MSHMIAMFCGIFQKCLLNGKDITHSYYKGSHYEKNEEETPGENFPYPFMNGFYFYE